MEARRCMNRSCGAQTSVHWKTGWSTKSGLPADLCFDCGSAYEKWVYCETYHAEQSGWRECSLCKKRLHCGCIASLSLIQILDFGGVCCISCATNNAPSLPNHIINRPLLDAHSNPEDPNVSLGFPKLSNVLNAPPLCAQPILDKNTSEVNNMQAPHISSLSITFHSPTDASNVSPPLSAAVEQDKSRPTLCQPGQRPRNIFPKPPKGNPANKSPFSPMRVARPPAEGRLRNQLLPRYWPRITDQELQKLSGDLNSTIVPLFEKILSASDASRIGRLVLPKACAEAYFPPINQSEGLPLKIQDVKGNEWTFQFRFWPNNNSRMYVLEGVTPCIQSMQLQAGDTVTFSRIDPGSKLVIGYRKASNTFEIQDPQTSLANSSGLPSGESFNPDVTDGLPTGNLHLGLQPTRGGHDDHVTVLPEQLDLVNGETILSKCENLRLENENKLQPPKLTPEKKKTRNFSSKSKRLVLHNEDAIELRLSWEETQGMLRPPPNLEPNIVMVEDIEFEEYSEPPVFGKRTYFTTLLSGVQDQWAQCDKCSKWRKLPVDVLLPPKWTCLENSWDFSRSSCDTSEETSSKELESVFRINKDFKKEKAAEIPEVCQGCEPSGLDALATAATLGDHAEPSSGATTRHPRHRPGCTCIVCIQPPSGKGKHKSSCVCNVCLTVKRRFKTLMMRKKKRQGEREAELGLQKSHDRPIKRPRLAKDASTNGGVPHKVSLENDIQENLQSESESSSKGHIDLNFHPIRENDGKVATQLSIEMTSLARATKDPSDMNMNANDLSSLLHMQQTDDDSSHQQANPSKEECLSSKEECHTSTVMQEQTSDDQGSTKRT